MPQLNSLPIWKYVATYFSSSRPDIFVHSTVLAVCGSQKVYPPCVRSALQRNCIKKQATSRKTINLLNILRIKQSFNVGEVNENEITTTTMSGKYPCQRRKTHNGENGNEERL